MAQSSPFRAIGLKWMKSSRGVFLSSSVFGTDLTSAHFSLLGWIYVVSIVARQKKSLCVWGKHTRENDFRSPLRDVTGMIND